MTRRLTLRSEHLADLTPSELLAVNGGAATEGCIALTGQACERLTLGCLTGYYPTLNYPCIETTG